jgi:hypothetical protein
MRVTGGGVGNCRHAIALALCRLCSAPAHAHAKQQAEQSWGGICPSVQDTHPTLLACLRSSVSGGESNAYRPRIKMFDSDPVAPGSEALPAGPLPIPFQSTGTMLLDVCMDAASGISVSVTQVVCQGEQAGCPAAGGLLFAMLSIAFPRWIGDVAVKGALGDTRSSVAEPSGPGRASIASAAALTEALLTPPTLTSRFDFEWQCSRDVYAPYVMKAFHGVQVDMVPGPFVSALREAVLVGLCVSVHTGKLPMLALLLRGSCSLCHLLFLCGGTAGVLDVRRSVQTSFMRSGSVRTQPNVGA